MTTWRDMRSEETTGGILSNLFAGEMDSTVYLIIGIGVLVASPILIWLAFKAASGVVRGALKLVILLISVLIGLALDVKLILAIAICLTMASSLIGDQWSYEAWLMTQYAAGLSAFLLVIGLVIEYFYPKWFGALQSANERDDKAAAYGFATLINITGNLRITSSIFGLLGLFISYALANYLVTLEVTDGWGEALDFEPFLALASQATVEATGLSQIILQNFNNGELLSSMSRDNLPKWFIQVDEAYSLAFRVFGVSLLVFIFFKGVKR